MLALEDLPPLSTRTMIGIIGLLSVLWLYLRVSILRRPARHDDAEGRGWLQRLAGWPWTYPALGLAALGLAVMALV